MMKDDEPAPPPDPAGKWDGRRERGEKVTEGLAALVRAFAFGALAPGRRTTSNLYMDPYMVRKGTRIGPVSESYLVDRDCVLCVADHHPRTTFAHECSYYLHDPRTGKVYRRIAAEFPPYPMEGLHQLERFHRPVPPGRSFPLPQPSPRNFEAPMQRALEGVAATGTRHAILFAGECDRFHLNDLELSYRTLIGTFQFDPANVHVLFHNGSGTGGPFLEDDGVTTRSWPGDNTAFTLKVNGPGTRDAFKTRLAAISLGANDLLFIHTAGHGGRSYAGGGQYLRLRPDGSDRYFSFHMKDDLQEQLAGKCQSLLLFMNQCFAGGFSDDMLAAGGSKAQNTYFAAACGADERAHSTADENWSVFALNWFEAEMQRHIDPVPYMPPTDDDGDGKVEAAEAFDYCVFMNNTSNGYDTPIEARLPAPDANDVSPADEIALV